MKMKKTILFIGIYLGVFVQANAQDPLFSQFFNSSMTLNPSMLGNDMSKEYKASFITRNKWWGGNIKPFTTNAISIEKQITTNKNYFNLMYLGVQMLNDRSGDGVLTNSYFGVTLDDKIKLTENDYISTALSLVYANRLVDLNAATFQTQFGSFGFIPSSTNYDPISMVSNKYLDMNAGVSIDHHGSDKLDYQFGLGLFHINKPNQSFFKDDKYKLSMRTVLHGTVNYKANVNDSYTFGSNFQNFGGENVFTLGCNYTRKIDQINSLYFTMGIWDRFNESVYPYLAIKYNALHFGLSYDIASSELRSRFVSTNSVEATLTWDIGKPN